MKFILNESNAKLILDERFVLLEETAEEFKPKEEELKKVITDKKTEISNILAKLNALINSEPAEGESPNEAAKERIQKYEEPCKKLAESIDNFLSSIDAEKLTIGSSDSVKAVDAFITKAKEEIYPGGEVPTDINDPELLHDIDVATNNIKNLQKSLAELYTVLGGGEGSEERPINNAPTELFSSDWTAYMKNAPDKKAAWEEYCKAWEKEKGPDAAKKIKSLGSAFLQELDKLGYTKANPFLVFLDNTINDFDFNWQNYGTIHNAYVKDPQEIEKETLIKKTPENLIYKSQWYKLNDAYRYAKYLYWQYTMTLSSVAKKPADIPDEQRTGTTTDSEGNSINTVTIDGLTIESNSGTLQDYAHDILYKGSELRDLSYIEQIANFFGAGSGRKKELSETDAAEILSKFGGMKKNDVNAQDLAKLIIYNCYKRSSHQKIMDAYDLPGSILKFNNPDTAANNFEKLKDISNLAARAETILNALVEAKKGA